MALQYGNQLMERLFQRENWSPLLGHGFSCHVIVLALVCIHSGYFFDSAAFLFFFWLSLNGRTLLEKLISMALKFLGLDFGKSVNSAEAFAAEPDVEYVSWLNELVSGLWNNSFRSFMYGNALTVLNNKLNSLILPFGLKPRFTSLDIGDKAPKISAARIYTTDLDLLNNNEDAIVIDIGLDVNMSPNITLEVMSGLNLNVHQLRFCGPCRFKLVPLTKDHTMFGGVEISFLEQPVADIGLTFFKPLFKFILKHIFKRALYPNFVYLPNSMIKCQSDHMMTMSKPIGLLKVNIMNGQNIGVLDSYVVARLGCRIEKTNLVKRNRNPVWNQVYEFPITEDCKFQELEFRLMQWTGRQTNLHVEKGMTSLNIRKLLEKGRVNESYQLSAGQGQMNILTEYIPVLHENSYPTFNDCSGQGILSLLLYEVQTGRPCKPMIVMQMSGRHPCTSSTGQEVSHNWEYLEEFLFSVGDIARDKLTISLMDFNAGRSRAKVTTEEILEKLKTFALEDEEKINISKEKYEEEKHALLGETELEMLEFTGCRQKIILQGVCGNHEVILKARLYHLENYVKF